MKKIVKIIFLFVLLVLLGACKHNKPSKTNSELFKEYYQENINACVKAMLHAGEDSLVAVERCECLLNALYEIDSTCVRKEGKELAVFLKKHSEKIDSLCRRQ